MPGKEIGFARPFEEVVDRSILMVINKRSIGVFEDVSRSITELEDLLKTEFKRTFKTDKEYSLFKKAVAILYEGLMDKITEPPTNKMAEALFSFWIGMYLIRNFLRIEKTLNIDDDDLPEGTDYDERDQT